MHDGNFNIVQMTEFEKLGEHLDMLWNTWASK